MEETKSHCCCCSSGTATRYLGFESVDVATKVGQIMLRFRPIAPKPAEAAPKLLADNKGDGGVVKTKGRRKKGGAATRRCCTGGRETQTRRAVGGRRKRSTTTLVVPATTASSTVEDADEGSSSMGHVASSPTIATGRTDLVTLPLMPEMPAKEEKDMSMGRQRPLKMHLAAAAPPASNSLQQFAVGSVVKVEFVAREEELAEDGGARMWLCWCGGEEARRGLYWDDSPAFISDAWERVTWTNPAYRRMVGGAAEGGVMLLLPKREEYQMAVLYRKAFTCGVTVKYCTPGISSLASSTVTAPCDVWRLADGNLAWRLDVEAALSLRR